MKRVLALLLMTVVGISVGALGVAAGPMGSVIPVETDKGCKAYIYMQDHLTGPAPKMPFAGSCTAGKPVNGKGKLTMPAVTIEGTWVNGVVDGEATLGSLDDAGKPAGSQKATFAMGCITAIDGHSGEMPGCKEAMAPYAKSTTPKPAKTH